MNRSKSIITVDRYGVQYVKNFTIFANGVVSLQYWTNQDTIVKTKCLKGC